MRWKWTTMAGSVALVAAYVAPGPEPADGHASDTHDPAPVRLQQIRLATGIEVEVAEAGPADGTPVLFLHGYTDSWHSFRPVLDRLPSGLRAVVPSQRGHGDSERPSCCYGTGDFAADAVALLDALGIERAAAVGHSMGSFVAQRIAIDHPERVSRLVLVGSGRTYSTPVVLELAEVVRTLADPVPREFVHDFQAGTAIRPLPAAFLADAIAQSRKLPARVWRDAMDHVLASDARDELHRIDVSTLVVWGEEDQIFPRSEQEALTKRLTGARLVVYEGTGHATHWEEPDRFVTDLESFLAAGRR